jgi:hypothetical protein
MTQRYEKNAHGPWEPLEEEEEEEEKTNRRQDGWTRTKECF